MEVNISDLHVGDQVVIVDHWIDGCRQNSDGEMDKWLGQVMTIRKIYDDCVKMEEDIHEGIFGDGWHWFLPSISYVINGTIDISEFM